MKAFLSATYADLQDYRRAAADALQRLGHQVISMEAFGARPEEPKTACFREVEESELVVGVYAHRYGFISPDTGLSITEQEYEHARRNNKPVFCFFVADDLPWPPKYIEGEPNRTKLMEFKDKVGNQLIRDVFSTPDDLAYKVAAAVGRYVAKDRVGNLGVQLKASLGTAELNSRSLSQGRSLSDVPDEDTRTKVIRLLGELRSTINSIPEPAERDPMVNPDTLLALAQGFMAEHKWFDAARKLEEYGKLRPEDWEANILRGVAFANSRAGFDTNLASLRAYNDAIAFLPNDIDANRKARLFAYRGALHKRQGRLEEAEADLMIAKRHASRDYEVDDIIYNLAGVFALQKERQKLLEAVGQVLHRPMILAAIRAHLDDYFQAFSEDAEFLAMIGAD